jgi:hypothetical protein
MVFTLEQRIFVLECYFRNGRKDNGVWIYLFEETFAEFQEVFPMAVEYKKFLDSTRRIVSNFRQNGSVKRKEGSGRPKVRSEEVINNVRQIVQEQPKISVRHLGLQLNIPSTTTHRILKQSRDFK